MKTSFDCDLQAEQQFFFRAIFLIFRIIEVTWLHNPETPALEPESLLVRGILRVWIVLSPFKSGRSYNMDYGAMASFIMKNQDKRLDVLLHGSDPRSNGPKRPRFLIWNASERLSLTHYDREIFERLLWAKHFTVTWNRDWYLLFSPILYRSHSGFHGVIPESLNKSLHVHPVIFLLDMV